MEFVFWEISYGVFGLLVCFLRGDDTLRPVETFPVDEIGGLSLVGEIGGLLL
jgi:hypothetical protein